MVSKPQKVITLALVIGFIECYGAFGKDVFGNQPQYNG